MGDAPGQADGAQGPLPTPGEENVPEELLLTLRKFVVPEFVFGRGALSLAGRQTAGLGVRRALLVADPGLMDGVAKPLRVSKLQVYRGPSLIETDEAEPGDIIVLSGVEDVTIGDTITTAEAPKALPRIHAMPDFIRHSRHFFPHPCCADGGSPINRREIRRPPHRRRGSA